MTLKFRLCDRGEILSGLNCEVCNYGKFSFEEMSTVCSECPSNANCSNGDQIDVNGGYWRKTVNSTIIYKCPKPSACLGGFYPDFKENPVKCKTGYSSYLCATCVSDGEDKYVRDGSFGCGKCPGQVGNFFKVIGLFLVFLIWIAMLCFVNL